jgi:hypothetical protein
MMRRQAILGLIVAGLLGHSAFSAGPSDHEMERRFRDVVQPFLTDYCLGCHGTKKQSAKLNLSYYGSTERVAKDLQIWERVCERLEAEEMPPAKASRFPSAHERRAVIEWITALREREAQRKAGDPGQVLARRLSNAEFDYTIRDLTGVDIRPTREFPVDRANEAGFDNSGESLTMSPALLKKYLAAARLVADHLVLKRHGLVFAPHPVITDTDRDKYCVQRIIDFYRRHAVDYADYFLAAWRFEHRAALGKPNATLQDFAHEAGLSSKYVHTIWSVLLAPQPALSPLGQIQAEWRKLPAGIEQEKQARSDCQRLCDLVVRLRKEFTPGVAIMRAPGISQGSQPFLLWRNHQVAKNHQSYLGDAIGADALTLKLFCRVFPDVFVVIERAPYYDVTTTAAGRLLSAGFHLMTGFDRDDGPLCDLVLDEAERHELDTLWDELHFITFDPVRQYKDFIFFERAEPPRFMQEAAFDFARSEDKDAISTAKIERLRDAYLAKARKNRADDPALRAIRTYFARIATGIRKVQADRLAAEPGHLEALQSFASRAYRRPLSPGERDELLAFYRRLRERDQLGHEDAVRDTVASILLSPHFCYRADAAEPGESTHAISDYSLASRLSYFLWSSMPDEELLAHAATADLHQPNVLTAQAWRMLHDQRVRGLAEQFAANWLEFRRFDETNTVDRERFPSFTNDLRRAMTEEPVRFFIHVAGHDVSVLDFLDGDYTFVNSVLAKHYGMTVADAAPDRWIKVERAHRFGRGGLLPMAIFLTKNSPGLRTSPVKRGYWVVRSLLGERIPPPPPNVPELPKDEAKLGEQTLAQLLARHRVDKACSGCHQRFDSFGLAFETYGPIGERRTADLAGHRVDAHATFPDGSQGTAVEDLRSYVVGKRQNEFIDNLCRKLFAYALGRSLTISDKITIEDMRKHLAANGYRFESLVEAIVTSRQFLNKRGRDVAGE